MVATISFEHDVTSGRHVVELFAGEAVGDLLLGDIPIASAQLFPKRAQVLDSGCSAFRVDLCRGIMAVQPGSMSIYRDGAVQGYLMLPTEMPSMKLFWKSRNMTISGSTISADAAISRLYWTS